MQPLGRITNRSREVRERLVGFGHAVRIFTLLHGGAGLVVAVDQFLGELLGSWAAFATTHGFEDPADRQGLLTLAADFDRNLIVRAADTLRANFDQRLGIFERLLEHRQWVGLQLVSDLLHGVIKDAFGSDFFAVVHQAVDELGDQQAVVATIRHQAEANPTLRDWAFWQ